MIVETKVVLDWIAVAVALVAAGTDMKSRRIPNWLTYSTMLGSLIGRTIFQGWTGLASCLLGGLLTGALFLVFFLLHTMGAGDVKLVTALGCVVGPSRGLQMVLAGAIAGGVLALFYALMRGRLRTTFANIGDLVRFHHAFGLTEHPMLNLSSEKAVRMPYAVPIAVGVLFTVVKLH
jgi:prepilin peptidase CpaA